MKLIALCLFAVCCSSLVNTTTTGPIKQIQTRKLREALKELNDMKAVLQRSEEMLNAPPQDIENGCCLSALWCFRDKLQGHFKVADKNQRKLFKSLRNPLTESSLAFCSSGNDSTCQSCDSYPKVNGREFFNRLESLIQRAISNLKLN